MDQELTAYLDLRFREISQQIAGVREENTQQIASLREETTQQIASLREEIASFREETSSRFERVEEAIRHTGVEVEGLRGQIQLLAEGMISFDQRLAGFSAEVRRDLESIRGLFFRLYEALQDRVRALESWRETKERDPLEIIKERFGLQGPSQAV